MHVFSNWSPYFYVPCYNFVSISKILVPATCRAHLVQFHLSPAILYGEKYIYDVAQCAIFSICLSLPPSYLQIFPSAPCSQAPSTACSLPLRWRAEFHTNYITLHYITVLCILNFHVANWWLRLQHLLTCQRTVLLGYTASRLLTCQYTSTGPYCIASPDMSVHFYRPILHRVSWHVSTLLPAHTASHLLTCQYTSTSPYCITSSDMSVHFYQSILRHIFWHVSTLQPAHTAPHLLTCQYTSTSPYCVTSSDTSAFTLTE
jgi:hypothetical protein